MFKMILVVTCFLLLTGCASHKPSLYTIGDQEVFVGWNDQRRLPKNAYFVLIEGDSEGTAWTVKEIYNRPIKGRSNDLQEVLFIDPEFKYVQPFFQYNQSTVVKTGENANTAYVGRENANGGLRITGFDVQKTERFMDRGSWECGFVMKERPDEYSPCNSRLTMTDVGKSIGKNLFATVLTAGLASGSHKVIDKDKVVEIIKQTDLFAKIKNSSVYSASR